MSHIKPPAQIARDVLSPTIEDVGIAGPLNHSLIYRWIERAIEADRAQRPALPDRIIVASRQGPARTWIGGDTVVHLLETINGYLEDGYAPEELIIEGITR